MLSPHMDGAHELITWFASKPHRFFKQNIDLENDQPHQPTSPFAIWEERGMGSTLPHADLSSQTG
jgi:hypothetical protein